MTPVVRTSGPMVRSGTVAAFTSSGRSAVEREVSGH
jgi:hypothetical protein